jgi:hypothetical protein
MKKKEKVRIVKVRGGYWEDFKINGVHVCIENDTKKTRTVEVRVSK